MEVEHLSQIRLPGMPAKLNEGLRWTASAGPSGMQVSLLAGFPLEGLREGLELQVAAALAEERLQLASLSLTSRIASHAVQGALAAHPRVRNVIAVGSGKGGVGKSTTSVNLALALAAEGARVGVLDADVYGPSVPAMLGLSGRPDSPDNKSIEPMRAFGVEAMSIGLLVDQDTPMIWRGPMATSALMQLFNDTLWGDLDYLLIDLPPGTGDIQLTLAQKIPVAGAVIVTTPQDIALLDAKKGLKMFEKVSVPILGVVENMAVYCCPNCGHVEHIFGADGGKRMAEEYGLAHLGSLPLNLSIRQQADAGCPTVVAEPDGEIAALYRSVARGIAIRIADKAKDYSSKFPTITISKST